MPSPIPFDPGRARVEEMYRMYVGPPLRPLRDVGTAYGMSQPVVARLFRRYGLPVRQGGPAPLLPPEQEEEFAAQLYEDYCGPPSRKQEEVAALHGVTQALVSKLFVKYGYETRNYRLDRPWREEWWWTNPDDHPDIDVVGHAGHMDDDYTAKDGIGRSARVWICELCGELVEPDALAEWHRDAGGRSHAWHTTCPGWRVGADEGTYIPGRRPMAMPPLSEASITAGDDHASRVIDAVGVRQALAKLPKRERIMMELRVGIDEEEAWTLEEIGAYFQLTRERVRQLEKESLGKLRELMAVPRPDEGPSIAGKKGSGNPAGNPRSYLGDGRKKLSREVVEERPPWVDVLADRGKPLSKGRADEGAALAALTALSEDDELFELGTAALAAKAGAKRDDP